MVRGVSLGALAPGTAYRYRLVASNPLSGPMDDGQARSFTTFSPPGHLECPQNEAFRSGAAAILPDCRAYEMVSPLAKENGDIVVQAELPMPVPRPGFALGLAPRLRLLRLRRCRLGPLHLPVRGRNGAGGEGWPSHAISPPLERRSMTKSLSKTDTEVKALSPDLCEAWARGSPNRRWRRERGQSAQPLPPKRRTPLRRAGYEALTTAPRQENAHARPRSEGASVDGSNTALLASTTSPAPARPTCRARTFAVLRGGARPRSSSASCRTARPRPKLLGGDQPGQCRPRRASSTTRCRQTASASLDRRPRPRQALPARKRDAGQTARGMLRSRESLHGRGIGSRGSTVGDRHRGFAPPQPTARGRISAHRRGDLYEAQIGDRGGPGDEARADRPPNARHARGQRGRHTRLLGLAKEGWPPPSRARTQKRAIRTSTVA